MFPNLNFEMNGEEPGMCFIFKATGCNGEFNIEYRDYSPEYPDDDEAMEKFLDDEADKDFSDKWKEATPQAYETA